ncbi:DUF6612 family protein [Anaeromicropila herbilytica]|uniref:Lipoprotein n=1 Tax=Anaeromicropila herbilytica TaxID=2785025 RepID=A0A7R7EKB7_9FIRM|nr:DUF6612 family protein [Anaeromicropila herbilytica]BCN30047.1 hypothetical protein bsdtb5_13420 [Anaeromicropila herbilytica]
MNKNRKILLTLLIIVIGLLTIGCHKKTSPSMSPVSMIKKAQQNLASAKNYDANMTMDFSMTSGSDNFDIKMKIAMTSFTTPYKTKMDMNIDMGALGSQDISSYILEDNNNYYEYMNTNGKWNKTKLDSSLMSPKQTDYFNQLTLDLYLSNAKSFKKVGTEKISNKTTIKLEGIMTGKSLKKMLQNKKFLSLLSSVGFDKINFKNLKDIPITMWLDQDSMNPVKMKMDMTSFLQDIMDAILASSINSKKTNSDSSILDSSESIKIPKCMVTIEYDSLGSASDFTVPDELKNIK